MMVKDEAKIIKRCLDSCVDYIDHWIITDTGSTDDTPNIITSYFKEKNIPGELQHHEWRDFGHNRTKTIRLAKDKADYLLLMDADFVLKVINPKFKSKTYTEDIFLVEYVTDSDINEKIQVNHPQYLFLSSKFDWLFQGRTHEHLTLPESAKLVLAHMNDFQIQHHEDGNTHENSIRKYKRDVDLLLLDYAEHPKNSRTVFYLGQSYFVLKDYANAYRYYRERVMLGGDYKEELYLSLAAIAECLKFLNKPFDVVLKAYIRAQKFRPQRLEALYFCVKYCVTQKKYKLAYKLAMEGVKVPYPKDDKLFVHKWIHEHGFITELIELSKIKENGTLVIQGPEADVLRQL